ncbi:hypothetical protein F5Y10DRAFT_244752, partial [Nemania abortiva]
MRASLVFACLAAATQAMSLPVNARDNLLKRSSVYHSYLADRETAPEEKVSSPYSSYLADRETSPGEKRSSVYHSYLADRTPHGD